MKAYFYPPSVRFLRKLKVMLNPKHNPLDIIAGQMKQWGDTYSLFSFFSSTPFIFTRDAALTDYVIRKNQNNYEKSPFQTEQLALFIGRGLLTNVGKDWLRQRRHIQPSFRSDQIRKMKEVMEVEILHWLDQLPKDTTIDLYPTFNRLTFNIISRTLFGDSIATDEIQKLSDVITDLQYLYARITRRPYLLWLYRLTGTMRRGMDNSQDARDILLKIISERRKSVPKDDLLQMLIDATYPDSHDRMDDNRLLDEVLILFVAGHETSANSLSFIFYLLGKKPVYQEKIKSYLARLDESIFDWEEMFRPQIIQHVIHESLRLYPPAWIVDRIALDDDSFGGFRWKKNTYILAFLYGLHRNPKYWSNPDLFCPERFEEDSTKHKPFYPFGLGQRYCIGSHFAMLEMELTLRLFFKKYRYSSFQENVNPIALVTLRPDRVEGVVSEDRIPEIV